MKYIYEYDPIFKKKVVVADGECLVCKHCKDMLYDDTHGPYMVFCEYTDKDGFNLCGNKKYGTWCNKYEYDGVQREVLEV